MIRQAEQDDDAVKRDIRFGRTMKGFLARQRVFRTWTAAKAALTAASLTAILGALCVAWLLAGFARSFGFLARAFQPALAPLFQKPRFAPGRWVFRYSARFIQVLILAALPETSCP